MQQHQQQQQGGSQFGAPSPDMAPFATTGSEPRGQMVGIASGADHRLNPPTLAEAASPISSRPPPLAPSRQNLDELVSAAARGSFPDDDAGEEVERGGAPGNRWPRQETLALLKIRSDMDAAFRDATLKGPLWEDVSRKLAELGFMRSAKKCKEKFENVQKYYKRTKEGRAGRQDGKSYRFFSQLEALHSGSTGTGTGTATAPLTPTNTTMASPTATVPLAPVPTANPTPTPVGFSSSSTPGPSFARVSPPPVPAPTPTPTPTVTPAPTIPAISASATAAAAAGISFSSDRFSTSSSDQSDDEGTEEGDVSRESRKRKRGGESRGGSKKMMAFFEGLMKQLMERQEAMQQRFLDTIEKREQDRMIREEAWKRQEMARLNREHELLAQERAVAASRDAAVISFLQKISGQAIQLPPAITVPVAPPSQPPPPPPQTSPPPPQPQQQPPPLQPQAPQPLPQPQPQELHLPHQSTEIVRHQASSSSTELVPVPEPHEGVVSGTFEGASPSSRWPKSEVHALIKIRSGLEGRYQEAGPKGPLWEEISQGMQRIGYNRSAKRCKEKWENINKYFKKVKESNKKRPEDAKTCPYFHQLDALYRSKLHSTSTSSGMGFLRNQPQQQEQEPNPKPNTNTNPNPQERNDILVSIAPPPAPEISGKNGNNNRNGGNTEGGGTQIPTTNGGLPPSFFEEGTSGGTTMKKPEDIVKELMERQHQQAAMDDYDSELDEDDDDDDDEDRKMQYEIQFQRQNVGGGGGGNASTKSAAAAAAASAAGSFLAMVQ